MNGAPTPCIKQQAGHASISTTERCMHLAPSFQGSVERYLGDPGFGRVLVAGVSA